jgi:transketolase
MKKMRSAELFTKATEIRIDIIKMLNAAGSGHAAGSLGMSDIFTALYFSILNHDPEKPDWPLRDRLILSNGHIAPVRYATMAHAGYFPLTKLKTLRSLGSDLQGHPERVRIPALETTSGPLGSGLGQASGIALAARMDDARFRVYCICSDGEHDEGNHWESVLFAAKYKLSNLTVFVDRNNIQIDGFTNNVMPLESLSEKYKAFNWNVLVIDGHDFGQILSSVERARQEYGKPTVIIANTVPGKGVGFMEKRFEWHGKTPNDDETKIALKELARTLKANS